jgi:hypothetical protein
VKQAEKMMNGQSGKDDRFGTMKGSAFHEENTA